ncbi:integrator complex subunit 5 [Coccinella septempunctata]|uniref:integrator complex subunit 5 n=1 Tax=Coccinella septempunctata TaxID=41139 RepID=UPI001D0901B6|nr:integrator complex subunit 5 [Coccinella septempunctata]
MISQQPIVKGSAQQDTIKEVHSFLINAQKLDQCNLIELTKTALCLLKTLPSIRGSVFEYFSKIFTLASSRYIVGIENEIKTGQVPTPSETDETIVSEIHSFMVNLICDSPESWSPIISTWSLELLGEISSNFSTRTHISSGAVLNETLQLWMGCRATRTLVDINTKCLSSLMYSDTEACINALLETSVKHSPNFDWVVAHVGSCFPNTVITRVLSCGLKDFCKNKFYEQGCNSPKLKSVVGILGHLAGSHANDIRAAIVEMFQWSLEPYQIGDPEKSLKKSTVPFILQLSYLSSTLLSSICSNLKEIISINVIESFYVFTEDWCKYFGTAETIEDLVMTLILQCNTGGVQIVRLLLECITNENWTLAGSIVSGIKEKCGKLLSTLLVEIDMSLRFKNPINLVNSFSQDLNEINRLLLSKHKIEYMTASRLVVFLGRNDPSILINSVTFIMLNSQVPEHLALLIKILTHEFVDKTKSPYCDDGGYLGIVLNQILSKDIQKFFISNQETIDLSQMWENLLLLLKWEKSEKVMMLKGQMISRAIYANLETITSVFGSEIHHMHVIAELLDKLEIPSTNTPLTLNTPVILNLTQSTVNYFFACCASHDGGNKIRGFRKVCSILKRLCVFSKVAKVLALRELLERALFRSDNVLFGAVNTENYTSENSKKLLLKQNKKISKTIPLTKHSSVFNGGIIGGGKRKFEQPEELPAEVVSSNISELINTIRACCTLPNEADAKYCDLSLESVTLVSLLLVQFVSPDVMYNGLPWPEEEFSKVTVERDLIITKFFKMMPLLWELLNFVGVYRPALCYCSVLLRALTAILIHQWRSMGDKSKTNATHHYNNLLENTIRVVDIMALGQLLPPPLSSIREVFPHLKSFEIVAILKDGIWFYMRDHVPSPALFTVDSNGIHWRDPSIARPQDIYTNSLRIILQRNIKSLGNVYSKMFINIAK